MANIAPLVTSTPEGQVLISGGLGSSTAKMAIAADGKIIVAGSFNYGSSQPFGVARLNADGTRDTTFGTDGLFSTGMATYNTAASVTLQSDGKIVVVGTAAYSSQYGYGIFRLNSDGTLDTSFNGTGLLYKDLIGSDNKDNAVDVAMQSNGAIVVVGTSVIGPDDDFTIVRLKSDGTADTSFSTDGERSFNFAGGGSNDDNAAALVIQPDGKILVAGTADHGASTTNDFAIVRFNANGSLDTTFSTDSPAGSLMQTLGATDSVTAMVLQADGKILLTGNSYNSGSGTTKVAVLRLNSDGTVDTTYGSSGQVIMQMGDGDAATSATLQADGKLIVAGYTTFAGQFAYMLARYNTNGTLDTTFGTGGKVFTPNAGHIVFGMSVKVQPDGKIVLGGTDLYLAQEMNILRYNSDGSIDTTFGKSHFTEGGAATRIDRGVHFLDPEGHYNGSSLLLTRTGGQNGEDVFGISGALSLIAQGGVLKVDGATIGTVDVNSGGKLLVTFGAGATQALIQAAVNQITYANTSEAPPGVVSLTWTFSDGGDGSPGSTPLTASTTTLVNINGINDAPVITSNGGGASAGVAIVENGTLVTTLTGFDVDSAFGFSLAGADAGRFVLVGNELHFAAKADFDTRSDANGDGVYDVTVVASDGALSDTQALSVSLIDVPGHKITGTSKSETIDKSHKIKGKGTTAENDKVDGKGGNDTIKGGGDNDTIIGGDGKDTLYGEKGHDRFVFNAKLVSSNVDLIKGFEHDIDVIALENKVFKTIGAALEANEFYAKKGATEAHDKNDRIIYDKKTGKLYYDDDGNKAGGHHAVQFATLDKHPVIDAGDFLIV